MKTRLLFVLVLGVGAFIPNASLAQIVGDYRSFGVGTAWTVAANWELCAVNGVWPGVASATYPGQNPAVAGSTVTIRNTHTRIISAAIANSIVNLQVGEGASGTLTVGNNATARTLTMTGNVTVSGGGTFQTANAGAHIINIAGNLTNNGTTTLNVGTGATLTFTGGGAKLISGTSATISTTNLSVTGGTVSFGNNTNARTLNITNTFTLATGTTFQSGITSALAHTINLTSTFTNNGTGVLNLTANSATNHTFNFTGTSTISGTATATATFYNLGVTAGTVSFGNNANARIIIVANDFAVSAGATFQSGVTAAQAHVFRVAGNIVNAGTINLNNSGTAHTLELNGATNKTISGVGTNSFNNVTLLNSGVSNVNVNSSILINGILNFSAANARLLIVNSSSNITLAAAATITNFDSDSYVQLDGGTGPNSNLIKTGTSANWNVTYPIGTSTGGYSPIIGLTSVGNAVAAATLSVKAINTTSVSGRLTRDFRLVPTGNTAGTTFTMTGGVNGFYYYNSDVFSGDVEATYTTVLRATSITPALAGAYSNVWGTGSINQTTNVFTVDTAAPLTSGTSYFFTIGAPQLNTSWYSYQSGLFNNPEVWTLDPSGTTLDNPLNTIPDDLDEITILNGFTVTYNLGAIDLTSTTINDGGTLDMGAVSAVGHDLGIVTGTGLLRVNNTNLPTGTYTAFVDAHTGGTIEYYNTGGTLPTAVAYTTYNNLKMSNTSGVAITYVLASNITVNGSFDISGVSGNTTWQINDASNTQRTLTLFGDLTVGPGGLITAGTGNSAATTPHNFSIYGNLTNSGTIKFFDPASYPTYGTALYTRALQGNTVTVTFAGPSDKTVACNAVTDFYRLVLNKGTGQQAMLTVNSTGTGNFRMFAPSNLGSSGTAPNETSDNALSIVNGTLQLTGSITIPVLDKTVGNEYFSIPQNGALWLNAAGVTVNGTDNDIANAGVLSKRLMLNGLLRVTNGTFDAGISAGIGSEDGGSFLQEGGTVRCWQFRPRAAGSGVFSFKMTGGTFNVGFGYALGAGFTNAAYARFDLNSATSTFEMSGNAVMNLAKPTNGSGIFQVLSSAANYAVTGGTVNVFCGEETAGNSYLGLFNSTAPLYNLNIAEESATTQVTQLLTNSLVVLNDLTIVTGNTPSFVTNNLNVTVGRDFNIQSATTYTPGTGVTTFNGSGAQVWTNNGTITSLASVAVSKNTGTTLTLAGANNFPNAGSITVALTLTSGTLDVVAKTLTVSGTGVLTNNATQTGTTGGIDYTSTAGAILGTGGAFGNLTITTNATIAIAGTQTVTGNLRLINANSTLNIGDNALTVLGGIFSDATTGVAFTATKRILTIGLHNSGGLTRRQQGPATPLLFPLGTSAVGANAAIGYTPNTILVTAPDHTTATITVRAVNSTHPIATSVNVLRYYWRVTSTGYTGGNAPTAVAHSLYTYDTAPETGTLANYRPAMYDGAAFTWAYSNTTFSATTFIPNFNTGTNWTNSVSGLPAFVGDRLDGEYTCGEIGAFGLVSVFYSRLAGPSAWNNNLTWSNAGVGGAAVAAGAVAGINFPGANNPVVIGDGTVVHNVTIDANTRSCGSLELNTNSVLDCGIFTGLSFGTNTGGTVSGRGTLRIAAYVANVGVFPAGDFGNFIGATGGTVEWYGGAGTVTLPTAGPAPFNLNLDTYYNLVLNPSVGVTLTLPPTATNLLTIYNDLTQGSIGTGLGTVLTNGARTLSVARDFTVTRGSFNFSNVAASATTLMVGRNVAVASSATMAAVAGGSTNTHTLTTPGNITNNGTMTFSTANSDVNIFLTGSTNPVVFDGTGTATTLNLLNINKGTSQTPTVDFTVAGPVTAGVSGWLSITNGTFNFANAPVGGLTIVSAAATYTIAPTAKIKVSSGTVNILSNASDAADLLLNGALEVAGGTVNIAGGASGNDIEYGSAGTPTITVTGGTLNVNGSIRRSLTTISGSLIYNQTGGTVNVNGLNSDNTRGVFEIDNAGSFTLTGIGVLNVLRKSTGTGTGYADVFINPATSNVSSTSTMAVGLNGAAQTMRINIAPSVGNFTVVGGTAAQTVAMYSNPMVVKGNLAIQSPSILNTNAIAALIGLDVSVAGNMTITGTGQYLGGANTTTFNGTTNQSVSLTGAPTVFNNMTISNTGVGGSNTVSLSGTSPTLNDLNILTGILDVGGFALNVNGDVTNNSEQVGSGSIVLAGASDTHNIFGDGTGSFTNLTLAGTVNMEAVVQSNIGILGVLTFATPNRYLSIGSNLLTLGSAASIAGAGSNAFVRTNGVESDLGVAKVFGVGAPPFSYEVGTLFSHTPVTMDLTVTTSGTITVIPVNSAHLTALFTNGSGERILDYYWIVSRDNNLVATVNAHTYSYSASLLLGSGGTLVAGYLDLTDPSPGDYGWVTSAHGGTIDGVSTPNEMAFNNTASSFPSAGKTYNYTVGTDLGATETLPNPIQAYYSRLLTANVADQTVGGDWNLASSWTLQSDGLGAAVGTAPTGTPVVILPGARINSVGPGRKAFITTISNGGLLVVGDDNPILNTAGHNQGIVRGTGTMRVVGSTFPAGNYSSFVAAGGGTVEYVATPGGTLMNSRNTYNNLSVYNPGGGGTVNMPNAVLTLNGNLTISAGTTFHNTNHRSITIAGNWINNGTYTQGPPGGNAIITFTGSNAQTVSGANTFTRMVVNKASQNVTLAGTGPTTVTTALTLTQGHIQAITANQLVLGSSTITGGSATSFIAGPMTKTIPNAGAFDAPLGSITPNRYRPATIANTVGGSNNWSFEYFPSNSPSFDYNLMNTVNIGTVSAFEHWIISRPGAVTADLTLTYGPGSYDPPNVGDVTHLRIARWDGTQWDLPPGAPLARASVISPPYSQSTGDGGVSGTITVAGVTDFSPFAPASTDDLSPLPIELLSFTGKLVKAGVELSWKTATETENDFFTVEKSAGGEKFTAIGTVKGAGTSTEPHQYQLVDTRPFNGLSYYRLKQTDFDGKFTYSKVVSIDYRSDGLLAASLYPNPTAGKDLTLEIRGLKDTSSVPVVILDQMGKIHLSATIEIDPASGYVERKFDVDALSSGVYLMKIGNTIVRRLVVTK
jgi:fibronectin-binding autotransporter adhesin